MKFIYLTVLCVILISCSLAPTYQRPEMEIPTAYKEAGKWIPVNAVNHPPREWWKVYNNQQLNDLEQQVTLNNQNLKAALARLEEARAAAAVARAAFYPSLTGVADAQRVRTSVNVASPTTPYLYNDTLAGANFSYELDAFGRIRNTVAAANNRVNASAADLAAMDLSLHAELASDYFILQGDTQSQQILDETVIAYKKALYLTQMRHSGGAAPESDVDQATTQLATTETLAKDIRMKRAQLEHAIAVLVGKPPEAFTLSTNHHPLKMVFITPTLPSRLLTQRPDIISAEQLVQAANAEIGVARAAFFPDFDLLGSIGIESQILANLISAPSLFWSIGPSAALILFDGGKINALLQEAKASYFESVANYRQIVLNALREVEDNLVAVFRLNQEEHTQAVAVHFAERALIQAQYRYKGGIITYLDVVVTQNTALQAQLAYVDVITRRQVASVQLIQALGGAF